MHFKIANESAEFEAIHRLNYRTFVEEIPQHPRNAERRLVDRFHPENTYAICLDRGELVGMICGRSRRPFSLDQKLPDLDAHLPPGRRVFEVRLLAVEPRYRRPGVFAGLAGLLGHQFRTQGFDLAVISGTTRQVRLYRHLGFVPFGPLVGTGEARFQPMYLTLEAFTSHAGALASQRGAANYLCGPVQVRSEVREAFAATPISHRSAAFLRTFETTRRQLCHLTGARNVQILLGSGTLANDAVAAQLALTHERGLVLSNGEFGERLIDQASRAGLCFDAVRVPWGRPFDYEALGRRLAADVGLHWLWAVHCETSTGVMNDIDILRTVAGVQRKKLCLDCISSIGTLPLNLAGVQFATGVSGKAVGAFGGLAMVFHDAPIASCPDVPRYVDLGYYASHGGVPFSGSSNLLLALQAALESTCWSEKFHRVARVSGWLRRQLRGAGFVVIAPESRAAPGVTTIALPARLSSRLVGMRLKKAGFLVAYESGYLSQRNWLQISLMGEFCEINLQALVAELESQTSPRLPRSRAEHRQPA